MGIDEPHPNLECEVCDDYDYCLPRWEDDGGGMDRRPPHAQAFEEDSEQDHGNHDRRPAENSRQPI